MTDMDENSGLCPLCFTPLVKGGCPLCKARGRKNRPDARTLPAYSLLKGRYRVGSVLGAGGFGITYAALDRLTGARVAIKEYFPDRLVTRGEGGGILPVNSDSRLAFMTSKARFAEEAKHMAELRNVEGVAAVLDFFAERGTMYIVMEYLDGVTLGAYLAKSGKVPFAHAYALLRPVMTALSRLHAAGFIHGDVAPDNIMLRESGATLFDFGAVVHSDVFEGARRVTLKKGYAPPEQYNAGMVLSPSADVYALGATLYRCVCGAVPPESVLRERKDTMKKPSACGAKITAEEEAALMRCLETSADARFPDMRSAADALDAAVEKDKRCGATRDKLLEKLLGATR